MASVDDPPAGEAPAEAGPAGEPETDELHSGLLAGFEDALGDAVAGSHVGAGDLWVRVTPEAWVSAGRFAREHLHCRYFCFLSAIDWQPSPFGRYEDDEVAAALAGRLAEPGPIVSGVAGGDTRFQLLARVYSTSRHYGVTLKADVPDDMTVPSWVSVYAGADWHERETWEMYGINFAGHPGLRHIYLPGDFEGHPLRKDYPLLARVVKPWPGIVDVEPMPEEEEPAEEAPPADPEAKNAEEIAPEEPPAEAPVTESDDVKPAVEAPVETHGEVASHEQLEEGEKAVDAAGGGGVDTSGIPTGEADSGRPGQGGSGQGTDRTATGSPEQTAEAAEAEREDPA